MFYNYFYYDVQDEEEELEEILIDDNDDEMLVVRTKTPPPFLLQVFLLFVFMWQSLFNISNAAITALLKFLKKFFLMFSSKTKNEALESLFSAMPSTTDAALELLGMKEDTFVAYPVCPKCNSIYELEYCLKEDSRGNLINKTCTHVEFRKHRYRSKRKPCGASLLKTIRLSNGDVKMVPHKVYCYNPLQDSLEYLVNKPGFLNKCQLWKSRRTSCDSMDDIYDGRIWKKFEHYLNDSFGLALGCDWFQPFKHISDSVGALYLVILNLPREERFKPENIILVGVIPGPKEPEITINSFLAPLIRELLALWDGIQLSCTIPGQPSCITIRACLLCVSCDLPAVRKLCGFAGHSACMGCSKCNKRFPSGVYDNKLDFSGYNRDSWKSRTHTECAKLAQQYRNAKSKSARKTMLSKTGVRFSGLYLLPYFDIVQMHAIDPMHNMLLGTCKHVMDLWFKLGIIGAHNLDKIQATVEGIVTPHNVGRVAMKISSKFSGLSADQWKNWVLIFSAIALKGNIPSDHYQCWLVYVRACKLLLSRSLTIEQTTSADQYLVLFCKKFESLFGGEHCTPNLHLHLHLKDCVIDFGPVYGFWCYPYERYNGILGSFYTNQRSIEAQIMRKFVRKQRITSTKFPDEVKELFDHVLPNVSESGSLSQSIVSPEILNELKLKATCNIQTTAGIKFTTSVSFEQILPPVYQKFFHQDFADMLDLTYREMYPTVSFKSILLPYMQSARATIASQVLSSKKSRSMSGAVVVAYWPMKIVREKFVWPDPPILAAGVIEYFVKHKVVTQEGETLEHILAYVKWAKDHSHRYWFGQSALVFSNDFYPDSACSFIPIQRIYSICAYSYMTVNFGSCDEPVFVVVPIHNL